MTNRQTLVTTLALVLLANLPVHGGTRGTVEFVDGAKTECEILFKHPNCDRLVVRSLANSTLQSFDLNQVASINGQANRPRRALSTEEKQERETNRLWADEVTAKQIGRYGKQTWEKQPVIVWAHPGESGDAMVGESWLDENGRPLKESPWEETEGENKKKKRGFNGDVLLPAAATQYKAIQSGNRDLLKPYTVRHLTSERNASYNVRYTIAGNLWLKDGSDLGGGTQTGGFGDGKSNRQTFVRFCGMRWPGKKKRVSQDEGEWAALSHWVYLDPGPGGSIEVIGKSGGAGDRLTVQSGTLIVSENSYIGNGNRGSFYTMPGTTAILLDGAGVGCPDKIVSGANGTYGIAGKLLFGAPEHPLQRDLRFEGCLFNLDALSPNATPSQRTAGASFVLGTTGEMVIHSADPKKARVIFCPRPATAPVGNYVMQKGRRQTPTQVTAVFAGKTTFNGVVFDGFYKGGIVVSPADRARWQNISFGNNNQGKPEELFQK
jgi:hypothetical protein